MEFATQYRHWDVVCRKMVMYRDKSHLLRFDSQSYCCRQPLGSNRFQEKFTKKIVKHPPNVMMGIFRWKGRGGLEFLSKGEMMNGLRYRQLFDRKLDIFMQFHDTSHILQDGALCRKANMVTRWFSARSHSSLIKWPGNCLQGEALNHGLFFADPPPLLLGAVSGKISEIR